MKRENISICEVCGSRDLVNVLDLGRHPMCDDLKPVGNHSKTSSYPVTILLCTTCQTAHQKYQIPKKTLFPDNYHYRSRLTADVLSGMESLVSDIESSLGSLSGKVVLDIGCNDGSLLDRFASKGAITIGVEPTGASHDAAGRGHKIYNEYFTDATASRILAHARTIDIITFTNVFAHIEDLPSLIHALRHLLHDETTIVIENHYLGSVLESNQFDTFYHEHPRTYSATSFIFIAKQLGLKVANIVFPRRYGGNIRVHMCNEKKLNQIIPGQALPSLPAENGFADQFIHMRSFIHDWKISKASEIEFLVRQHGPIPAKAFPGRAAILITMLGLDENQIQCIFEKPDSPKIGHYAPGTRIPIVSDELLFESEVQPPVILNLAWHIKDEIASYLSAKGYTGKVFNVI
jgi:SAM-dependent methyltransferase